ncbi:putative 5-3 exonuclease [Ramicandelaber brevisporus]|nr:putative 5-3 exonuclease [Ramicandelaber brevisporus]
MGVPSFYRWVVKKYPKVSARAVEEIPQVDQNTGFTIPVDPQSPNPNNLEFDNLYLDMNGIIHPCCNPPKPNEEEMFVEIFRYIERIFAVVRPRKVLFMAIDGVAPRAKMNQQRSRRFRAAHDKKMAAIDEGRYSNADEARLFDASVSADGNTRLFDTNCITPGTPFMYNLAKALRTFIAIKLNTDPAWRNLNVILSDANVPGEGEHKIMDFIRSQRSSATHDPNTRHVIHGLDADLIMLALATHEPHFSILREDVLFAERLPFWRFTCCQWANSYGVF